MDNSNDNRINEEAFRGVLKIRKMVDEDNRRIADLSRQKYFHELELKGKVISAFSPEKLRWVLDRLRQKSGEMFINQERTQDLIAKFSCSYDFSNDDVDLLVNIVCALFDEEFVTIGEDRKVFDEFSEDDDIKPSFSDNTTSTSKNERQDEKEYGRLKRALMQLAKAIQTGKDGE